MNKIVLVVGLASLILGAFLMFGTYLSPAGQAGAASDYKDATYFINEERVTLLDGVAETVAAPGSASKVVTRYVGNEVRHDFDGDGREDVAFLLSQETGGTGVFYYVVAARNTKEGYIGSPGFFLGDRIAPQTTELGVGDKIVVNYAVRAAGESFAVQPSVAKSVWLIPDSVTFQPIEVEHDFEGEADPARMTLFMKKWQWISATLRDGAEILPRKKEAFALTFMKNGTFAATTDCNGVGGNYAVGTRTLAFSDMVSTLMYCADSQEGDFAKLLEGTESYFFTAKGELIFNLKLGGSVVFR